MRHQIICSVLCILLLHVHGVTAAQKLFSHNASVGFQGHYGSFLAREPKALYLRDSYTHFGEIYYQRMVGESAAPLQPSWGVGLFHGATGSHRYIGSMSGAYSFLQFPLFRAGALSSSIRSGMGLGWIEKPYNKDHNYKNALIGSHLNGYFHVLVQAQYQLSGRVFANAGLSFSHLSNGTTTIPNLGLNIPALSLGVGYRFTEQQQPVAPAVVPADRPQGRNRLALYSTAALKQYPWVGSKRYLINALTAEWGRRYSRNNVLGAGLTAFYNPSLEVDPSAPIPIKRDGTKLQAGLYASWEHTVGRIAIPLQLGTYVFNKLDNPPLYQQLGLRYRISPRWRGQMLLKTHMGRADFIHAGLGYQIK
ncbi:acyloxyacyl hydrolase [Paraflavisolibacter sp. H34]|uniref:acyloxyacyl hydrolase n=1 Tax=Huijunlia imazamoxiresistens TaxID=3127457 RepID=UPI00301A7163